jgi:hypothetical protein
MDEGTLSGTARRRRLLLWVGLLVVAVAAVTPTVIALTRPLVGGWAETVGFTAALVVAPLVIRGLLRDPLLQSRR